MEDKSLYKYIRLVYNNNTTSFNGNIELKAGSTIRIDKITIRVIFEVRGTLRPSKFILETIELDQQFLLEEGQLTKIPFEFDCSSYEFESYTGTHFEFAYKLESIIFINEADKVKVERGSWEKLKSITDLHTKIEWERAFVYKKKKIGYQVKEGEYTLESQFFNYFMIALTIFASIFMMALNLTILEFIPIIFVIGGLIYILNKALKTYLTNPYEIQIKNSENGFYCLFKDNTHVKIKAKKLHYQVNENVTDNRGTRPLLYSEMIFQSKPRIIDPKLKENRIDFVFPKRKVIRNFHHPYIEFKWVMKLEFTYLNIPINFHQEFAVENIELEE